MHECPRCGRSTMPGHRIIIDVWPAGVSGAIARGRWRLQRADWRRLRRRTLRAVAWIAGWSVATVCVAILLLALT